MLPQQSQPPRLLPFLSLSALVYAAVGLVAYADRLYSEMTNPKVVVELPPIRNQSGIPQPEGASPETETSTDSPPTASGDGPKDSAESSGAESSATENSESQ